MDKKNKNISAENEDYLPPRGNPEQETVYFQIGGTVYEVETSCGGNEKLLDKMIRLLKADSLDKQADKEL